MLAVADQTADLTTRRILYMRLLTKLRVLFSTVHQSSQCLENLGFTALITCAYGKSLSDQIREATQKHSTSRQSECERRRGRRGPDRPGRPDSALLCTALAIRTRSMRLLLLILCAANITVRQSAALHSTAQHSTRQVTRGVAWRPAAEQSSGETAAEQSRAEHSNLM